MTDKPLLSFDTETHRIDQAAQLPKIVCLSMALNGDTNLVANATPDELKTTAAEIISDRTCLKIGQNVAFDLGVFCANYPDLIPAIFKAMDDEQFSCTMIREKLLNLASTGNLEYLIMSDGSKIQLRYGMEAMLKQYKGLDISAEKVGTDTWRMNFGMLDGVPLADWPQGAVAYVKDDALHPIDIWKLQEAKRQELIATRGIDPFATESFRIFVDFCLKLMGSVGVATDPVRVAEVEALLAKELAPEKLDLLISSGILRPATPPMPYKNGATETCDRCSGTGHDPDQYAPDSDPSSLACKKCKGQVLIPKMAAGKDESVDNAKLKEHVLAWARALNTVACPVCVGEGTVQSSAVHASIGCEKCGASGRVPNGDPKVVLTYTDPSDKFPEGQLSITTDFLAAHAHLLDPTLKQFQHRAKLQKLVTTEIPRMKLNGVVQEVVYPQFDCLKETGRVSSFASKPTKDKPQTSAQFNCQSVDPRVKGCYVARKGKVMWASDFSQMELGSLAQVCYKLFGYSVLRDKINAGVDVHAYTGAQLAFAMDAEFQKDAIAAFGNPNPEQLSELFLWLKGHDENTEQFKFYKHWRKFAKPVNLGYPGGLGPPTFVTYAASEQYGVHVTVEEAKTLRELWKQTYPEMVEYFAHINKRCVDPHNKGWDADSKEEYAKYCYTSPYGLYRAGCDYCACANGLGLQTPSADGALTALIMVTYACYVPGVNAILGPVDGRRTVTPTMFVHDELIGEMDDDDKAHERCMEIKKIMIECMAKVTPDVKPNANVCLMRRWDKAAEPVLDEAGHLKVWEPKPKQ